MDMLVSFLAAAVVSGTPLLFATLGGIMNEKVGNLNLGVEGMMLMGAVMGFMAAVKTSSVTLALVVAGLAGGVGALIYAFLTVTLKSNQVVTGLTLTIFGTGFSSMVGKNLIGLSTPIIIRSFILNGIGGIGFGYLYWKKGLSYAILAHMLTHVFMQLVFMPIFF